LFGPDFRLFVLVFVSRDFKLGINVSVKSLPSVPHEANLFYIDNTLTWIYCLQTNKKSYRNVGYNLTAITHLKESPRLHASTYSTTPLTQDRLCYYRSPTGSGTRPVT